MSDVKRGERGLAQGRRMIDDRPAWHREAACRGYDPAIWFPTSSRDPNVPIARRICAACPVRTECFETACANRETQGIWAGYLGGRELNYARTGRHRPKVGAKLTPDAVRDIRAAVCGWVYSAIRGDFCPDHAKEENR